MMFRNPLWQPDRPPELVEHLVLAARGVTARDEGWFFTGRRAVLTEIVEWLDRSLPGIFVVTGPPGCGKSAVVGRIAALSDPVERAELMDNAPLDADEPDPGEGRVGAAIHLRGLDVTAAAKEIADRLGLSEPVNANELLAELDQLPAPPVLILDGLDEAAPDQVNALATELVVPLGRMARVLLASRDRPFHLRAAAGERGAQVRLRGLVGEATPVRDLAETPGTAADLGRYVAARMRAAGRDAHADVVARVLADRAAADRGGFLYARIVAGQIAAGTLAVDRDHWQDQLAADVADALDRDLDTGPTLVRDGTPIPGASRDLLRALAWSAGRGLPGDGVWEAAAAALSPAGHTYAAADLDWLLTRYGRYIVEDTEHGQAVYRLYHREFVTHLRNRSSPIGDMTPPLAIAVGMANLVSGQAAGGDHPERANPHLTYHLHAYAAAGGPAGVAALRRLAEANPDAYLPDLAMSLNNLANQLAEIGQRQAALAPAQEAAELYRALAEANPDAYLPDLAGSLNNLAVRLAAIGQRQAALAPAQEAVTLRRALAEANPDAYLPDLAGSLNNLAVRLAEIGQRQAAVSAYDHQIHHFAGNPAVSQYLTVQRALFRHGNGESAEATRDLTNLVGEPASAQIEMMARRALREIRTDNVALVDDAWRSVVGTEPPRWLSLTASRIGVVSDWLATPTWHESLAFAEQHADELLDASSNEVLDEVALSAPEVAAEHHALLESARLDGFSTAYQPYILIEAIRAWMDTGTWEDSRAYLDAHPDLLAGPDALNALYDLEPSPATTTHAALLNLIASTGTDTAYQCLTDRKILAAQLQHALTIADPRVLESVAVLEAFVHDDQLAAAVHVAAAAVLAGAQTDDADNLARMAETADPADRNRLAAELTELLTGHPEHAGRLAPLLRELLAVAR
jgi:hypothetical protein